MRPDRGESGGEALSRDEIVGVVEALTDEDKTTLAKIARLYATKTPYDAVDLMQEAMCRVLGGDRKWPKDIPPLLVLSGVMRSVAWQWRRRELALDGGYGANDWPVDPPQEWQLYFEQFVASFEDDPVARAVLLAIMAGNKGTELLAVIDGILNSEAGVEARGGRRAGEVEIVRERERVTKKIRRRLEKHRLEGGL
jgi:DNA-directed RNA polymerase specialized sigma24 family protein